jgi:hypothetical protein
MWSSNRLMLIYGLRPFRVTTMMIEALLERREIVVSKYSPVRLGPPSFVSDRHPAAVPGWSVVVRCGPPFSPSNDSQVENTGSIPVARSKKNSG